MKNKIRPNYLQTTVTALCIDTMLKDYRNKNKIVKPQKTIDFLKQNYQFFERKNGDSLLFYSLENQTYLL